MDHHSTAKIGFLENFQLHGMYNAHRGGCAHYSWNVYLHDIVIICIINVHDIVLILLIQQVGLSYGGVHCNVWKICSN